MRTVISSSVEQTRALGAELAGGAKAGDVIALSGPLGAGKTELVRGFVAQMAPNATVRSPSFTLVNVYEGGRLPVYHFDFYRLGEASELYEIGLAEYLSAGGVCLIEWAEMFAEELPTGSLTVVRLSDAGDGTRHIEIA